MEEKQEKAKPTGEPWRVARDNIGVAEAIAPELSIIIESDSDDAHVAFVSSENPHYAARIVRCVNAHDKLLKAAKRALAVFKAQGESVREGAVTDALSEAIEQAECAQ